MNATDTHIPDQPDLLTLAAGNSTMQGCGSQRCGLLMQAKEKKVDTL